MNELHLRPRTVTELVDAAFTLYRRNPLPYLMVCAVAFAPALVLETVFPTATPMQDAAATASNVVGAFGELLKQVVSTIAYVFAGALVVKLGSDAYLGGQPDVAVAVRHVGARAGSVIGASFLKGPLYVLGTLALIVGALYVTARWFAVGTVVVLEDKGAMDAFGRSTQLSAGRKRHILNTILLSWIIFLVFVFGVSAVIAMLDSDVATQMVGTVVMILGYPLVALTNVVLYYDARIRGEGFDLEQMAGALDAPSVSV